MELVCGASDRDTAYTHAGDKKWRLERMAGYQTYVQGSGPTEEVLTQPAFINEPGSTDINIRACDEAVRVN